MSLGVVTEQEFIQQALVFFRDVAGEDDIELSADNDLYDAPLEALKSIRTTYDVLVRPAATTA